MQKTSNLNKPSSPKDRLGQARSGTTPPPSGHTPGSVFLDKRLAKRNGLARMERDPANIPWRFLGGLFLLTLVLYFAGFYGVEHIRSRKGPWVVTFDAESAHPTMTIRQPALGIDGFQVVFKNSNTNGLTSGVVQFDNPKLNAQPMDKTPESSQELKQKAFPVPFGECIYQDLMILPGIVTMNLLGHEIELMPRTLVIDKNEVPWSTAGAQVTLEPHPKK